MGPSNAACGRASAGERTGNGGPAYKGSPSVCIAATAVHSHSGWERVAGGLESLGPLTPSSRASVLCTGASTSANCSEPRLPGTSAAIPDADRGGLRLPHWR
jgi:hypothetical protein